MKPETKIKRLETHISELTMALNRCREEEKKLWENVNLRENVIIEREKTISALDAQVKGLNERLEVQIKATQTMMVEAEHRAKQQQHKDYSLTWNKDAYTGAPGTAPKTYEEALTRLSTAIQTANDLRAMYTGAQKTIETAERILCSVHALTKGF